MQTADAIAELRALAIRVDALAQRVQRLSEENRSLSYNFV